MKMLRYRCRRVVRNYADGPKWRSWLREDCLLDAGWLIIWSEFDHR